MATVSQPGVYNVQEFTSLGALAAGYRLYTYTQGTTTKKVAYTDAAGATPQTYTSDGAGGEYIALDARGELPAPLYLTSGAYDLTLKTSAGATVWTRRADPTGADLATSAGAALVGFLQAGTGAVARTAQAKMRESVSVLDFGADPTGVADSTAAIQAAIDALNATYAVASGLTSGGGTLYIPSGKYKISGLTLKNGVSILGDGKYQTLLLMTTSGGTALKGAAATTQVSAGNVIGCTYEDFTVAPDPAVTFSTTTVLWNMTGFTLGTWADVQMLFQGNVVAWQLTNATLAGSGGPSNWHNSFYDVYTIGINTGGVGWDLGDTLAAKEQITTWNWYGGRTASQGATGIGMRLNSATGCNLYGHCFEALSDELIVGSAAGTRGCANVNFYGCYFEGSGNGYTIYPNATNTQIVGGFATGVTNSDTGVGTTIFNNSEFKFPVSNSADSYNLVQADASIKPQVKGSTGPGWRLNNASGNWLDIWNGAATSSATDYLRVDDVASRTLVKSGSAITQFYSSQLSIGNQSTVGWFVGSGTPEGAVTAGIGSIYMRTNGGAGTAVYIKESGVGNTGWVGK